MPPERTLTDADVQAIALAIRDDQACVCSFSPDEVAAVKDLLTLLKETRSNVLKGVLTVLIGGFFVIVAMGFKAWSAK